MAKDWKKNGRRLIIEAAMIDQGAGAEIFIMKREEMNELKERNEWC